MKYSVKISPVKRNQSIVTKYLTRILGARETAKARDLVRNGGIVRDDLSKSEAGSLARGLRNLGVVAEILDVKNPDSKKGYQLTLLDAGRKKIAVIKEVRGITGLGLKEAKELVDNLGIVGTYKTEKEAEQIKKKLTSAGAKVDIKKLGGEEPEPSGPDTSDQSPSMPENKPLRLLVQDENDKPLKNVSVVIKTPDDRFNNTINPVISDGQGEAAVPDFSENVSEFFDELPPVKFEVSGNDARFITIHQAFDWNVYNRYPNTRFIVQVKKDEVLTDSEEYIVFGEVRLSNSRPVEACTVRAFDRDLRSEQFLGESLTDSNGSYRIIYTEEQFKQADNGKADLLVRVFNPVGKLLSESDIYFNAPPNARIDLTVSESAPVQPSEYDWLVSILSPLLDGVSLPDLNREDVWFLANKTGRTLEEVAFLAEDARLAQRTGMPNGVFFALVSEWVGVLPSGGSSSSQSDLSEVPDPALPTMLKQPVETLLDILKRAISNNLIPVEIRDQLDEIQNRFELLKGG